MAVPSDVDAVLRKWAYLGFTPHHDKAVHKAVRGAIDFVQGVALPGSNPFVDTTIGFVANTFKDIQQAGNMAMAIGEHANLKTTGKVVRKGFSYIKVDDDRYMRLATVLQWLLPRNKVMWTFAHQATDGKMLVPSESDADDNKSFVRQLLKWESGPHITLRSSAELKKYNRERVTFSITEWRVADPHEASSEHYDLSNDAAWCWVMLKIDNTGFVRHRTEYPPHMSIAWVQVAAESSVPERPPVILEPLAAEQWTGSTDEGISPRLLSLKFPSIVRWANWSKRYTDEASSAKWPRFETKKQWWDTHKTTLAHFRKRVTGLWEKLWSLSGGKAGVVGVVTHGHLLQAMLGPVTGDGIKNAKYVDIELCTLARAHDDEVYDVWDFDSNGHVKSDEMRFWNPLSVSKNQNQRWFRPVTGSNPSESFYHFNTKVQMVDDTTVMCKRIGAVPVVALTVRFVRHAQSVANAEAPILGDDAYTNGKADTPLSKLGRQQAQQLHKDGALAKCELVLVSPLSRAIETALISRGEM